MKRFVRLAAVGLLSIAVSPHAQAQERTRGNREPRDPAGVTRIVTDSDGAAEVTVESATGAASFVRPARGRRLGLFKRAARAQSPGAKVGRAAEFFAAYGSIFGVSNATRELEVARVGRDARGGTHVVHRQVYRGLPVFAGELRSHFAADDELEAVNGTFVPDISVDPNPSRTAEEASRTAVAKVEADLDRAGELNAANATLLVFAEGLLQGVAGPSHLAWQVEVSDGGGVREFVYVDAHTGKFVDQITGTYDGLNRRAYDGLGFTAPGPNYPAAPFWVEGDAFPTGVAEADNMIASSGETYDLFERAFGRDSFDGAGATMDSIFNRGNGCPNASWNGTFISFCPGTTSDDVTAHEWGHAYTEYTHNLIYQWQSGALNESYSDIWGEVVDRINGRGTDAPGGPRSPNACSVFTPLPPEVTVNSPAAIAGEKTAGTAAFGPQSFDLTGNIVLADDGVAPLNDGCTTPFANAAAVSGNIALIDRGTCAFTIKVKNAQLSGATGVIIANNAAGIINMSGVDPTIVIPALSILQSDGAAIKANFPVNASLSRGATGTDNSYRWLMGEDATAFGGAIRDMWNPTCYGNPGKVSDTAQYVCSTADGGGVHTNSGVPNHAFALVVDGGSYNGQSIAALGLTKAAHIYFRAASVYQGPATDFADHADALEQSCSDLVGANLTDISTGAPSGQLLTASDCAQVAKALLAVEMRNPPTQCNFQPLLAQAPPPLCADGGRVKSIFEDDFDRGRSWHRDRDHSFGRDHDGEDDDDDHHGGRSRWVVSHTGVTADFTPDDWRIVGNLPDERRGRAFFGVDPPIGTCAPGGDESGVLTLISPKIVIPASAAEPMLTFDHWVATEGGWDGGNLKISVNGGPWLLVQPGDFVYNPYNASLFTAAQGNTNPLAGEPAFTGGDGGSVGGTWGRSIVNLAPYAGRKDKLRLRYDIGRDGCGGVVGWYLDDVMVYQCKQGH
jgi:Zn-dependent metalloprotease